jgi:hypothetical protein
VEQRTQEIGIRMALGAVPADVRKRVVLQSMWLAVIGVAADLAAALALPRLIASLLYELKPWDPAAILSVAVVLIAIALLATYVPARRASQVDLIVALRYERAVGAPDSSRDHKILAGYFGEKKKGVRVTRTPFCHFYCCRSFSTCRPYRRDRLGHRRPQPTSYRLP